MTSHMYKMTNFLQFSYSYNIYEKLAVTWKGETTNRRTLFSLPHVRSIVETLFLVGVQNRNTHNIVWGTNATSTSSIIPAKIFYATPFFLSFVEDQGGGHISIKSDLHMPQKV